MRRFKNPDLEEAIEIWSDISLRTVKLIAMSTFQGQTAEDLYHNQSFFNDEIDQLVKELEEKHNGTRNKEPINGES